MGLGNVIGVNMQIAEGDIKGCSTTSRTMRVSHDFLKVLDSDARLARILSRPTKPKSRG